MIKNVGLVLLISWGSLIVFAQIERVILYFIL